MTTPSRTCPYCSAPVTAQAFICPSCGRVLDVDTAPGAPEDVNAVQPPREEIPGRAERPVVEPPPGTLAWGAGTVPPTQRPADFTQPGSVPTGSGPTGSPPTGSVPPPPYSPPVVGAPPRRGGGAGWVIAIVVGVLLTCCLCLCLTAALVLGLTAASSETVYENSPFPILEETEIPVFPGIPDEEMPPAFDLPTEEVETPEVEATEILETPLPGVDETEATPTGEAALPDEDSLGSFEEFSGASARFSYPAALASGIREEQVEASGGDNAPWDIYPAHSQYFLEGYPVAEHMHEAQIFVYPVEEYISIYPDAQERISELERLLRERPDLPSGGGDAALPFMPFWNAGQVMHAAARYLEGDGMSGIRYVTQYGQDVGPVASDRLFYTFQGLTDDGRYYVSAVMPVTSPVFPNSGEYSAEEYQQLADNYQNYITVTTTMIDAMEEVGFTPSLAQLDAIFKTFRAGANQ